jgi:hypothetical protein
MKMNRFIFAAVLKTVFIPVYPIKKSLIAKGEEDILFGKLNIDGEVLWLKGLGSERYDISKSIVYSSLAKRVYIGGNYRRMIPEGTLPNQNEFYKTKWRQ